MRGTRKFALLLTLLLALGLVLSACGGGDKKEEAAPAEAPAAQEEAAPAAAGDPAKGEELFKQTTLNGAPGCITCHSLDPDVTLVGPSLAGVATRAAEREPGKSAEEYLRESILDPNAYVVEGFPEGVMPQNFGDVLSEEEINDLVAFLLTLK